MKYFFLTLIICVVALSALSGCSGKTPTNLGMIDGKFTPCPESANCVSTQAGDETHHITPIKAHGSPDVVMVNLASTIESMFGGKIIKIEGNYLHAEFTSRLMRFVDDMECFYNEQEGIIEIRSASRIGYSDFNVNRKRVEELRSLFSKTQ